MTRFLDGPAANVTLSLARVPIALRVVERGDGSARSFDALDRLDDSPKPDETIHVYVLVGQPGWMHMDGRDRNGRRFSRTVQTGTYRFFETPRDEDVREAGAWRDWVEANRTRLLEAWGKA